MQMRYMSIKAILLLALHVFVVQTKGIQFTKNRFFKETFYWKT